MRIFIKILFLYLFFNSYAKANAFSEVFGSEGASGIANSKIRSLSYTFQYFTLVGSIGYLTKQLYNSGFMEPVGFVPDSINNLSPLAYKKDFLINNHTADVYAVSKKVDQINFINDYKNELFRNKFSVKSIEMRNNSNFSRSLFLNDERNELINRYLNE
jgi:hypothetical protein